MASDRTTSVSLARTPDGRRLEVARVVPSSPDAAWDLLVDTHRWPEWGPSVTAVECDRRRVRAGSTGRVRTVGGLWLPFEVTACTDRRWTWRVAGVPATGHRVEPAGDGARVVFELPVAAAGYVPVLALALRRIEELLAVGD